MRVDQASEGSFYVSSILVVMNPRDSHATDDNYARHEPDVVIELENWAFQTNKDEIEKLRRGDLIQFNATVTGLGSRAHMKGFSKYK